MVSLPLSFGNGTTEFLDRIGGNFYGGLCPDHHQEQKQSDSAPVSLYRMSLSHSLDE